MLQQCLGFIHCADYLSVFCTISPSVQLHSIFLYVLLIALGYFLYVWKILQFLEYIFSNTQICKVIYFFSHENIDMMCFTCHIQVWIFKSDMFQCKWSNRFSSRDIHPRGKYHCHLWSYVYEDFECVFIWHGLKCVHVFCASNVTFGAFYVIFFSK